MNPMPQDTYTYIPETKSNLTTILFPVELIREQDGRWRAGAPAVPTCITRGYSREHALMTLQEAISPYVDHLVRSGTIPRGAEFLDTPVVAVTL